MTAKTETNRSATRTQLALLALVGVGALAAGRGCGGVTDSRIEARDEAAQHTCMRYQTCGDIGAGLTYTDFPTCITQWQANWDNSWPAADCQGKIDSTQLSVCLGAIDGTSCTNVLDILDTILVKCAKASVCDLGGAPADAGTD